MATTTGQRHTTITPPPPPPSKDELAEAIGRVAETAAQLFEMDSRVHSVGVGSGDEGRPIYRAVRNKNKIVAQKIPIRKLAAAATKQFAFPVQFVDAEGDASPLYKRIALSVKALGGGVFPEQQRHRPLVCGLQIQNFDDDSRQGLFAQGEIIVGSIGCFVKKGKNTFILSNNHVVAGENRGKANDRILQQGAIKFNITQNAASLGTFVPIQFSPVGATVLKGNVVFNDVDAGIAKLVSGAKAKNQYLSGRKEKPPVSIGTAQRDALVSKVGRTTGPTHGKITSIATIVGPVAYDGKPAWFRNSIEIEGIGMQFSDHGDSGSAIVNENGELVGLLYAGNGTQTYACPIAAVLEALGVSF
ncbi:MAG TPA: trypsin-like serine protease [Thermoanaerobaculia bacterium]|nr:trypsin-like serine protease [Thermoanaerobaculia bacterium]